MKRQEILKRLNSAAKTLLNVEDMHADTSEYSCCVLQRLVVDSAISEGIKLRRLPVINLTEELGYQFLCTIVDSPDNLGLDVEIEDPKSVSTAFVHHLSLENNVIRESVFIALRKAWLEFVSTYEG
ncbi:hypothetical protein VPHF86_0215 [Vibrio phage F86]